MLVTFVACICRGFMGLVQRVPKVKGVPILTLVVGASPFFSFVRRVSPVGIHYMGGSSGCSGSGCGSGCGCCRWFMTSVNKSIVWIVLGLGCMVAVRRLTVAPVVNIGTTHGCRALPRMAICAIQD